MKRRLFYLTALLVVLAGVLGPALYMHKVFSGRQQYSGVEIARTTGSDVSAAENAAGRSRTAAALANDSPSAGTVEQNKVGAGQGGAAADGVRNEKAGNNSQKGSTGFNRPAVGASPGPMIDGGCRVWVAVVGKNDELLFGPAEVTVNKENKWGITAMGALDAAGIVYTMKPAWPDFVDAIGGQANSGMSGWMYSVNGEISMHMADQQPVKTGDRVVWWYSRSMDQPPPQWEDLVGKK